MRLSRGDIAAVFAAATLITGFYNYLPPAPRAGAAAVAGPARTPPQVGPADPLARRLSEDIPQRLPESSSRPVKTSTELFEDHRVLAETVEIARRLTLAIASLSGRWAADCEAISQGDHVGAKTYTVRMRQAVAFHQERQTQIAAYVAEQTKGHDEATSSIIKDGYRDALDKVRPVAHDFRRLVADLKVESDAAERITATLGEHIEAGKIKGCRSVNQAKGPAQVR